MYIMFLAAIFALMLSTELLFANALRPMGDNQGSVNVNKALNEPTVRYGRDELLALREMINNMTPDRPIPEELKKKKARKRGRKGGIRARLRRRGCRIPLPTVIHGNVRSLRNKMDELASLCRFDYAYRTSSLMCFTETWLKPQVDPDNYFQLDGFKMLRSDREGDQCKNSGGGLCIYVNDEWCKDCKIVNTQCDKNLELMTVSLRPFYLPREFSKIYVCNVYVPPDGNARIAAENICNEIENCERINPDSLIIICGDFNHCNAQELLTNYTQYVTCCTRNDTTLDLFLCNVKDSYVSKSKAPLGLSDHNIIQMLPKYKQKLKREKPVKKTIQVWDKETEEKLLCCMETTDWSVLIDENATLDENVSVVTSYIEFCIDTNVKTKVITCYPNNKPWVTHDLKELINKKRYCKTLNDRSQLQEVQRELRKEIEVCKEKYKTKVENMFAKNDTKSAWRGLKILTNYEKKSVNPEQPDASKFCSELNQFYCRFDVHDFKTNCTDILETMENSESEEIIICEEEVVKVFGAIKADKAAGPDNLKGRVIKLCKNELAKVFTYLFQQSVSTHYIPKIWKTAEIVPIAKKDQPKVLNDYRPIALTPIVMKCFEKIIKNRLLLQVKTYQDPLQFAYTNNRSVEDPIVCLVHDILKFLDTPNSKNENKFAKILYVDFSSAFNTIQPHLLMQKLVQMNVQKSLIQWIHCFLTARMQYVKYNDSMSDMIEINTGAPQGCVLSPVLFTLYTSDCRAITENCKLYKYADDTALLSLCNNNDQNYRLEVNRFVDWCDANFLLLNVKKTKEMIIDFRTKNVTSHDALIIQNESVEQVKEYKYLGTIIDDQLKFEINANKVYKKANMRLFFLRKLANVRVDNKIMDLFYTSIIQSVLSFCAIVWYCNINVACKNKLNRIVKAAGRLGLDVLSLNVIFEKKVCKKVKYIISDDLYPLHNLYNLLPSGRRLSSVYARTTRFSNSFVPSSIRVVNKCDK